jgi:hypothetical protein
MARGKKSLSWLLVLALGSTLGIAGCVVRARAGHPTYEPPPPRYVEVSYRPGYVWVDGNWVWRYGEWQWQNGYYVRERPGYYYSSGYWDLSGGVYVWRSGAWNRGQSRRRSVRVRDHRRSSPRPAVRDNRSRGSSGTWIDNRGRRTTKPQPTVRSRDHRRPAAKPAKRDTRKTGPWGGKRENKEKKTKIKKRDHR